MAILTFKERVGDFSPSSASIGQFAGSTTAPYTLELQSATPAGRYTELQNSITAVLGFTGTRVTDGRIQRQLPLRHPITQWMFADSISQQGVGPFDMVTPSPGPGSALINQQVPIYKTYEVQIPCSPRPYNMWQDADIKVAQSSFYYKDGVLKDFRACTEWHRFTEWITAPRADFLTAQQGLMRFRVQGGALPDMHPFQDAPRMFLPDSTIVVNWYFVPYRFITSPNSYLSRFLGYINQFGISPGPINPGAAEQYPPGSLLYQGATVSRIYTNPVPDEGLLAANTGDGFNKARLCDLQLTFGYTPRTLGATAPTPANSNWIASGWNLLYWLTTRKAYYVTSEDPNNPSDATKWVPNHLSLPFSLLFTDPDAPQPFGTIDP